MKDWKTSIAIVPFLAIAFLIHEHALNTEQALTLLSGVASYLAFMSADRGPRGPKPA